jgi:hypothetical protein
VSYGVVYVIEAFRLGMNSWLMNVESMNRWFNPMYSAWLFGRNRKEWAKQTMIICLIGACVIGGIIVWGITFGTSWETFESGCLLGSIFPALVTLAYYERYWK